MTDEVSAGAVIVWLDPGETTGLAQWDTDLSAFWSVQLDDDRLISYLVNLHELHGDRLQIGWELFNVTSGPRSSTPEHSIGAIDRVEALTRQRSITVLKGKPSSGRKLGNVVYLRRLGWYRPGMRHANDAAQHLLAYLLCQRPMPDQIKHKLFPDYHAST